METYDVQLFTFHDSEYQQARAVDVVRVSSTNGFPDDSFVSLDLWLSGHGISLPLSSNSVCGVCNVSWREINSYAAMHERGRGELEKCGWVKPYG